LSHSASPFCVGYCWNRVSHLHLGQLYYDPPICTSPCTRNDMCKPHAKPLVRVGSHEVFP
jgi:hypothetical protein